MRSKVFARKCWFAPSGIMRWACWHGTFALDGGHFVAQSYRLMEAKETIMNDNKRLFALLSLGLMLAALLGPMAIAAFALRPGFALAFGMTAALLALVFGVLSWSDRMGKTVATTLVAALIIFGGGSVAIYLLRGLPNAETARDQQSATVVIGQ
jgi:FtsH-binding integral membrane protein